MPATFSHIRAAKFVALASLSLSVLLLLPLCLPVSHGQTPPQTPPARSGSSQDQSDVLRVYTELVQTDVMVFDKQGRFVDGLKSGDFELRIDGKVKPVDFFERVTAGSINEEMQIAAARGSSARRNIPGATAPAPLDRGRPIFFYVDDLHLDLPSLQTTQKLITRFIDNEMRQNDEAAITSASGQIGFLQQLTDNKAVLRAALERLKFRPYTVKDLERPSMTEYQAVLITHYDHDVLNYFVDETVRLLPGVTREVAEAMVNSRALATVRQGAAVTANTLSGLEGLIKTATKLPGRKLVFFISGGFFLDDRVSDSLTRLQRITSAAARAGVVVYSMDARGLVVGGADASTDVAFDPGGRLVSANSGELRASQDAMNALANDTGGRAVFNTNSLNTGLGRALKETANYYLLAWKPETEEHHSSKFRRIEVKVAERPDLTVHVRRGFFDREPEATAGKTEKPDKQKKENGAVKSPADELRKAMLQLYPERDIPVSLSLTYLNTPPKGLMLSTAMQVPNEFLSFVPVNGKQTAVVTVLGAVFDQNGKAGASFQNQLTIEAPSLEAAKESPDLKYGYPIYLGPGLYQVRVGVRDHQSGRSGTAHSWVEIPNIASGQLTLSSLMLGSRTRAGVSNTTAAAEPAVDVVDLSVAHNFSPNGYLRFLIFAYNAARASAASKPDLAVQVQLVRDEQPVLTTALKKISVQDITDLTKIPYAAEISLSGLPAGRYVLQVTVVDRVAKKSATQRSRFDID
jgi:VWFA-related protein